MKTTIVTIKGCCKLCEFCNEKLAKDWNQNYVTCLPYLSRSSVTVDDKEVSVGDTPLIRHLVNTAVLEPFAYRKQLGLGTEVALPLVARWDFTPDRYIVEWHYPIELDDNESFDASKLHFIRVDEPDFDFINCLFMSEYIMYGDRKIEANEQNEFMLEDNNDYREKVFKRLKKMEIKASQPAETPLSTKTSQKETVVEGSNQRVENKDKNVINLEGATSIKAVAFKGNTELTSIIIPDTVTVIGAWAFQNCTNLVKVVIPNSVTKIEAGAFQGCTALTEMEIPVSVTVMEHRVFKGCSSLKMVSVLGAVKCLDDYLFQNCEALTTVTLGNGIKKVSQGSFGAFDGCTALKKIYVPVKKADYYKKRLPENLHALIVEQ